MRFVAPKVAPEEARRILSRRPKLSLRRKREMKKMELVYLPYYIHRVVVSQRNQEHEAVVCTDGICSVFSFFDATEMALCEEALGAVFDFLISPEDAERACRDNLRWHLVHQGLRLKVRPFIKEILAVETIHYPYWVAYFKGQNSYDFRAADAVTGEVQGIRMRETFLTAFSQDSEVAATEGEP